MNIDIKSKKVWLPLVALFLVGGVTAGIAIATGGNGSANSGSSLSSPSNGTSLNTSTSSLPSSGGSSPSANEEQEITDFQFSNGQFIDNAYSPNFEPRRFIDDGQGGFYAVGGMISEQNNGMKEPGIVRVGPNYQTLWTSWLSMGYQEGTLYSTNQNYLNSFQHGLLLSNGDLLVFGEMNGYLLSSDGTTRSPVRGFFEERNLPTTANRYFIYGIMSASGTFTLIDLIASPIITGDGYVSDIYRLPNDEFLMVGRAVYGTGLFEGLDVIDNGQSNYLLKIKLENNQLTVLNRQQFQASSSMNINRSFLDGNILVMNASASGAIEGSTTFNYSNQINYALLIGFNIQTWTTTFMTGSPSLVIDRSQNSTLWINNYNVILGHDQTYLALYHTRGNNNTLVTTYLVEVGRDGTFISERILGEVNTNSTYFIGRTQSGYFTLGNTFATTGPYASNGDADLLMTILDRDFNELTVEIWGGNGFDAMQSWPTVLNNGALIFGGMTQSTTGTFAEAFNLTNSNPYRFLIVLS